MSQVTPENHLVELWADTKRPRTRPPDPSDDIDRWQPILSLSL